MSIDQSFVHAFARRNRQDIPEGEMQVDPSVADSAQIWVDPIEDELLRADTAQQNPVPRPHIPSKSDSPEPAVAAQSPSDHVHTAYVFAASPIVDPTPTSDAPVVPETVEPPEAQEVLPETPEQPIVDQRVDSPEQAISVHTAAPEPASEDAAQAEPTTEDAAQAEPVEDQPDVPSVISESESAPETVGLDVVEEALKPLAAVWEVDRFEVPNSVAELFFDEDLFQVVAKRLKDAVGDGLQSMMVTSTRPGEGRSTIAIGMALAAAATGLNVVLVDGDLHEPTLVDDLRLDVEQGWLGAIRSNIELDEVAVYSIEDGLTLLPLIPSMNTKPNANDIDGLFRSIEGRFDLIVVDAPSGDATGIEKYAGVVDSAVIARDVSRTDMATINTLSIRLRNCGLHGIGIVENFT